MSDVVERLAKRWHSPLTGRGYGGRDGHAEARWWMNAHVELFKEREVALIAMGRHHEADAYGIVLDWLRTQATKEGEDG